MKRSRAWIRPAILAVLLLAFSGWLYLDHVDPRYEGRRASEWLQTLFGGPEEKAGRQAIDHLGEKAIPQIKKLFYAHRSEREAKLIYWINAKLKKDYEVDFWQEHEKADTALDILGNRAAPMIPELIESLADSREDISARSANALARIGDPLLAPLKQSLQHSDADVKIFAIKLLTKRRQRDIYPVVEKLAHSPQTEVSIAALESMAVLTTERERTIETLRLFLKSANEDVRACAVNALGHLAESDPKLVDEYVSFIRDASPQVRYNVTERLWFFCPQHKTAQDALIVGLKDSDADVWTSAVSSLCITLEAYGFFQYMYVSSWDSGWGIVYPEASAENAYAPDVILDRRSEIIPLLKRRPSSLPGSAGNTRFQSRSSYQPADLALLFVEPEYRSLTMQCIKVLKSSDIRLVSVDPSHPQFGILTYPKENLEKVETILADLRQLNPHLAGHLLNGLIRSYHFPKAGSANP